MFAFNSFRFREPSAQAEGKVCWEGDLRVAAAAHGPSVPVLRARRQRSLGRGEPGLARGTRKGDKRSVLHRERLLPGRWLCYKADFVRIWWFLPGGNKAQSLFLHWNQWGISIPRSGGRLCPGLWWDHASQWGIVWPCRLITDGNDRSLQIEAAADTWPWAPEGSREQVQTLWVTEAKEFEYPWTALVLL